MKNIAEKINASFRSKLSDILGSQRSPHLDFLCLTLKSPKQAARELFQYGFENLPAESERPNMELATYFLILSELSGLPSNAVSLALDLMLYCENEVDGPDSLHPKLIEEEYRAVLATL